MGRSSRVALAAAVAAAGLSRAAAWWADGHMLVAQIAYNNLSSVSQNAVNALIDVLALDYPKSPDFVTASCWADDIKSMGVSQWNNDHYVDLPVVKGAYWWDLPAVGNTTNAPWAINAAVATLSSTVSTNLDKALQLRFLIHFVGDLHQPLHAASLFSTKFKTGDGGGNAYKIAGVSVTNLHSFWDSGAEQWADDLARPLNASGRAWLANWVDTILTTYPPGSFPAQLAVTNVFQWAVDSNDFAANTAYNAAQAPTNLSGSYIDAAKVQSQYLVSLAGFRLAAIIESIFNPNAVHAGLYAAQAAAAFKEVADAMEEPTREAHALRGGRN